MSTGKGAGAAIGPAVRSAGLGIPSPTHRSVWLVALSASHFEWLARAWSAAEAPPHVDGLAVLLGGVEPPDILSWIAAGAAEAEAALGAPGAFGIVADGEIVGVVSFKGAPRDVLDRREIEIGYGIAASRRRRGSATAAVRALVRDRDEGRFGARLDLVAETSADNVASQRVLEEAGFTRAASGGSAVASGSPSEGSRLDPHEGELLRYRAPA